MINARIDQTQTQQLRQQQKMFVRLEQSSMLEMDDGDFRQFIAEIESSPLFIKLYQVQKIIRYKRYAGTDISSKFYQLKEGLVAGEGTIDVQSLLINKETIVNHIQKIGLEKFKRYFLYNEPDISIEDIAFECNLNFSEVQEINRLIDEFSTMSEFYNPSAIKTEETTCYAKIASVEMGHGGLYVGYYSPSFARGKYSVDYERFEQMVIDGDCIEAEVKEIKSLFKKLELINSRKNTLNQILQAILERQALYFESGNVKALVSLSQKELAKMIGIDPSTISRAIHRKSIDTPWGEEKPLKDFFPRPNTFKKLLIKHILENDNTPGSDEDIRAQLEKDYGISMSRRSVARFRKELKFPSSRNR